VDLRQITVRSALAAIDLVDPASWHETILRLVAAGERRGHATDLHGVRTGRWSRLIAGALGFDDDFCELLGVAAMLHDIGKVAVSDRILLKRGPLSPSERTAMQTHTSVGHDLLSGSQHPLLELAASIALTHHERIDGSGYPFGAQGDAIPEAGRIVAVADTFDALTSDRPYRPAYTTEEAVHIVASLAGRRLDPSVIDALLDTLDEGRHP
jgi:two-component system, response regulator RpfG